ncbi:MAG: GNAT family N-acetyltransferase [Pseudomonadota bacterium]
MTARATSKEPVRLRPLRAEDADQLQVILSDANVAQMLAHIPHPFPADGARTFLTAHVPRSRTYALLCAITEERVTPAHAAPCVGLVTLRSTEGDVRLGYYLAPETWGRGLATSAVRQALNVHFGRAPETAVEAGVFEDNPASIRVLEKMGFHACDGVIDDCAASARDVPHRVYRLDARAWSAAI